MVIKNDLYVMDYSGVRQELKVALEMCSKIYIQKNKTVIEGLERH